MEAFMKIKHKNVCGSDVMKIKHKYENVKYEKQLYFPKRSNVNFDNLMLSGYGSRNITTPQQAVNIIDFIKRNIPQSTLETTTILDAFGGWGGDTISLSSHFKFVVTIEKSHENYISIINNIKCYNIHNVFIINRDCLPIIKAYKLPIIYMDPPWSNITDGDFMFDNISLEIVIKNRNNCIFFVKVPKNFRFRNISRSKVTFQLMNKFDMLCIRT